MLNRKLSAQGQLGGRFLNFIPLQEIEAIMGGGWIFVYGCMHGYTVVIVILGTALNNFYEQKKKTKQQEIVPLSSSANLNKFIPSSKCGSKNKTLYTIPCSQVQI